MNRIIIRRRRLWQSWRREREREESHQQANIHTHTYYKHRTIWDQNLFEEIQIDFKKWKGEINERIQWEKISFYFFRDDFPFEIQTCLIRFENSYSLSLSLRLIRLITVYLEDFFFWSLICSKCFSYDDIIQKHHTEISS